MIEKAQKGPGKGIRRWHPRTFTGCQQCRRRHVRCDLTAVHCFNCTRLNLVCDGYRQKIAFKILAQEAYTAQGTSPKEIRHGEQETGFLLPAPECSQSRIEPDIFIDDFASTLMDMPNYENLTSINITPVSFIQDLSCPETRYYSHFLSTVSNLLIVYDAPHNANPYRLSFPQLAQSFSPLAEVMKALGALHLANISTGMDRVGHNRVAMEKYGEVVNQLRLTVDTNFSLPVIATLATSLLLCFFEVQPFILHNIKGKLTKV